MLSSFTKIATAVLVVFLVSVISCKKSEENNCGSQGGIVSPNVYLFWVKVDVGCGPITVTVKDSEGRNVTMFTDQIKNYQSTPPECNNVNYGKYARVDLYQGKTYTYEATCPNHRWTGTINVACEQNQCRQIELK